MHRRGRRTLLLQLAVALCLLVASCSSSSPGSEAEFSVIGALEQLPANALAYDSQDEAKEHQAGLENWLMTTTVLGGDPVSEVFQVTSVEVRGHELVASVDFVDDRGPVGFAGLQSWLAFPLEAQAD